jgi:hypothetical protein
MYSWVLVCNKTVEKVNFGQICELVGLGMKHGIHFYITHFGLISTNSANHCKSVLNNEHYCTVNMQKNS